MVRSVPGISSEFKSRHNKPFIVANDEKKKILFLPVELLSFKRSFEIMRQWRCCELARSKAYLAKRKTFVNSRREKTVRPNGERFPSAACRLNSYLCYEATIHGNVYECDRIVKANDEARWLNVRPREYRTTLCRAILPQLTCCELFRWP